MTRASVALSALIVLVVALLWTGIAFVSQRQIIVWTDSASSDDGMSYDGTTVDVFGLGLTLLALGILVTAAILFFEAYIRPARSVDGKETSPADSVEKAQQA
ncbi:hypothetical protein CLV49_1500 [Labedella gwakjiensis]|uniref:Uncharacterized protein n=1 Tax=Labedella gwakjiensis TaxID=390269 RepID=A0A2P8GV95_9MICO|nr:hypothetical protein [Labedella gwakjiensis]PSL37892.1 hypothetical protein CLV49_1500 [Labedella gwakjiensis]RUQ87538.1 hypothetical protein ELQ93_11700 [Labedella gwakjiensis]